MIGSKFSHHFFNQSEVKPKPIVARACTFSRALCRLRVITSSFDWFTGLPPTFLIGQSNYFGFGFYDTHLETALGSTRRNPIWQLSDPTGIRAYGFLPTVYTKTFHRLNKRWRVFVWPADHDTLWKPLPIIRVQIPESDKILNSNIREKTRKQGHLLIGCTHQQRIK